MPPKAPITLTLYNPETGEVIKTVSTAIIPTAIFTEIAELVEHIDMDNLDDALTSLDRDTVESFYAIVAELFGNRVSVDEIKYGTELPEFIAVIQNLIARVEQYVPEPAGATPNPTPPGKKPRKKR